VSDDRPQPGTRRDDGLMYCCDTLGWVTPDVAFDHRWDTSREREEYRSERASAWDTYRVDNSRHGSNVGNDEA
jgi:hypothetical protein